MRRTMESVAAERLNKIGIRDHNITNGSASDNEATSVSPDAPDVSAIVSALAHQQSADESSNSDENESKQVTKSFSDPSLHSTCDKRFARSTVPTLNPESGLTTSGCICAL